MGETRTVGKDKMTVAVKKIENFRKREEALKEAETLMKLDHRFIIKWYGHHFEDNGRRLCIVLEFADRGTFTEVITEAAQDPGSNMSKEYNIWRGLSHLTDALNYLHTQPILHRDLKPDNILGVTHPETGNIDWKLADFGLVKLLDENTQGDFFYAQSIKGTPNYMAPEVWTNYKGYTFSADIWSLGCVVAFRCNRGEHLFQVTRLDMMLGMAQKMNKWRGLPQGTIKGYSSDKIGYDVRYGPEDEQVEGSSSGDHQRLLK